MLLLLLGPLWRRSVMKYVVGFASKTSLLYPISKNRILLEGKFVAEGRGSHPNFFCIHKRSTYITQALYKHSDWGQENTHSRHTQHHTAWHPSWPSRKRLRARTSMWLATASPRRPWCVIKSVCVYVGKGKCVCVCVCVCVICLEVCVCVCVRF